MKVNLVNNYGFLSSSFMLRAARCYAALAFRWEGGLRVQLLDEESSILTQIFRRSL